MTVIGIASPTSADPIPPLKVRATSPSGRTATKEVEPTQAVTVFS